MSSQAPLQLICFYTSGMHPISSQHLPEHDDWGIKYMANISEVSHPIKTWEDICVRVYRESRGFIKDENKGVFARFWKDSGTELLALAIADKESKGAFRDNVLLAVFHVKEKLTSLLRLLEELQIGGNGLPLALKELKNDPQTTLTLKTIENIELPCLVKHGSPPLMIPEERSSSSSETRRTARKKARNRLPWFMVIIMALVLTIQNVSPSGEYQTNGASIVIPASLNTDILSPAPHSLELEKENIELQQQVDLLNSRLREREAQLDRGKSLAQDAGGWDALQNLVELMNRYSIESPQLENEIQRGKESERKIKTTANDLNRLLDYLKKERSRFQVEGMKMNDNKGEQIEVRVLSSSAMEEIERLLQSMVLQGQE